MKKIMSIMFAVGTIANVALADSSAEIKCVGKSVTLTTETTYLGESSKFSQTLVTVQSNDVPSQKALFLDVKLGGDVDSHSMIHSTGKNEKGGNFLLKTTFWANVGDGTIINEKSVGTLTVKHGNLNITDEAVECVRN